MPKANAYWVYILEVKNGHYYTGYTNNIARRYLEHRKGTKASKYTRNFGATQLLQCWSIREPQGMAMKIECFIKRKTRKIKEQLVQKPLLLKRLVVKEIELNLKINPVQVRKLKEINDLVV